MQRKNPSFATLPNAPIDLTPLLDIIFIFLFALIISNANDMLDAREEAEEKVRAAKKEVELLQGEVEELNLQVFDLTARQEEAAEIRAAYEGEVIGKRVKIVNIYCTYDMQDSSKRKLFVEADGLSFEPVDFNSDNSESAFRRLSVVLEDYVKSVRSSEEAQKSERAVVMLAINKDLIQRRDKERIDLIIEELEQNYSDVY